jgi:diacylglycerol kinase (ATP)
MKTVINSFNHAIGGIMQAFKLEKNMKVHFILMVAVIVTAIMTHVTRFELIALVISIAFVLFAELLNTAVEAVCDLITKEYNEFAKIAKNVAAGAVLIAAANAVVVGYLVFYRKFNNFALISLDYLNNLPAHVTFASLMVLFVVVIILKSRSVKKRGTYVQGGMPSGHTAFAFALFTAIALTSRDPIAASFSAVIALIVAESRMETKVHTFLEVAMGALLGILITVIVFQVTQIFVFSS